MKSHDRIRGALIGLATGDALGAPIEFKPPGTFKPLTDMIGGGTHNLPVGYWTDDTSMALCLATSLIEKHKFDALDQIERYVRWWREGYMSSTRECFDIGNATSEALQRYQKHGDPFAGSTQLNRSGNGSLMRLAPVAMFFVRNPATAIDYAAESSRVTHASAPCIDACRYFAGLLAGAMRGASKEQLLAPRYSPVNGQWEGGQLTKEVQEVADGSFLRREPPQITGKGYVLSTLEAALWAFAKADNFRDGCLLAANLGDDTDTTAAVYGQIAGAFYGENAIPEHWRAQLTQWELLDETAEALYHGPMSRVGNPRLAQAVEIARAYITRYGDAHRAYATIVEEESLDDGMRGSQGARFAWNRAMDLLDLERLHV